VVADLLDKVSVEGQTEPRLFGLHRQRWRDGTDAEHLLRSSWRFS
jgi:hypothetical protein